MPTRPDAPSSRSFIALRWASCVARPVFSNHSLAQYQPDTLAKQCENDEVISDGFSIGVKMTIEYSLARKEIARNFARSMAPSPIFMRKILLYAVGFGLIQLLITGALHQHTILHNVLSLFIYGTCFLLFFPFIIALLGKTSRRSLTISSEGISTQIGTMSEQMPWKTIQLVTEQIDYVLIAKWNGNAFFIPARAFQDSEQKNQFFSTAKDWANAVKK